jgi:hypothetical protein
MFPILLGPGFGLLPTKKAGKRARPRCAPRFRIERLEARELPSAYALIDLGVLSVGTLSQANAISQRHQRLGPGCRLRHHGFRHPERLPQYRRHRH